MSLWLADLGVNWLIAKEQRKVDRRDRRDQRRREKALRHEIDGPVRRREPKLEDAVSEAAQAEARRRLAEALERAGVTKQGALTDFNSAHRCRYMPNSADEVNA
jgi:hypothetical protein